jgi:predicted Zn-dependent protease with MMP-like domain
VVIRRRGEQARRQPSRRINPDTEIDTPSFEDLVEKALDGLPTEVQKLLDNVAIVIEDEPTADDLERAGLRPYHTLYGLYDGVPGINYGADWSAVPNKITIFRLPLEEDFPNPERLANEVQRTVLHEIGHHAGLGHARLRKTRVG